jgi:type IV secretory pathway TraG/TraD family ATPase VirD4
LTGEYEDNETEKNKLWKSIFNIKEENTFRENDEVLKFLNIKNNKIYYVYNDNKDWYFSSYNSETNPFLFKTDDLLKGYIV